MFGFYGNILPETKPSFRYEVTTSAPEDVDLKSVLGWLWENCSMTYRPGGGDCPIEHNAKANKDCRAIIEGKMAESMLEGPDGH